MIEILPKEKITAKLLTRRELAPGKKYKWSCFVCDYEKDGRVFVYNNLSTQLYQIENGEVVFEKDRLYTAAELLENESLKQLAMDYFLVVEDQNEDEAYEQLIELVVAMYGKREKGYSSYTILPTTACNARCFYCFEKGMEIVTMSDETVNATIDYILKTKRNGKITLSWFGGEPLVRSDIIDRICSALRESGVEFVSNLTTNGSLITPDLVQRMKDEWKLNYVQITVDGDQAEYDRRKAYVSPQGSMYPVVMDNIGLLNRAGIRVNLRCNFDRDNLPSLGKMLDDLDRRFPDKKLLSLEFVPLYQIHGTNDELNLYRERFAWNNRALAKGFAETPREQKNNLKVTYCMAQTPDKAVVIAADGRLFACEHFLKGTDYGTVFDGVTKRGVLEKYTSRTPVSEKCSGCFFLPKCSTFDLCPVKNASKQCKAIRQEYLNRFLDRSVQAYFNSK